MNTHSHSFPLTRVLAAVIAACALLIVPAAAQAVPTDPTNLAFTSTAPTGVKYGDKLAYQVVANSDNTVTPITFAVDASSSTVCKLTGDIVSVLGAGTCKINADQVEADPFLAGTATQSFSIAKASLSITASSSSNFFGGSVPSIAAFYSGFVNGDSSSKLKTKPSCSTTAIAVSHPGVYPTSCSKAESPNYSFTYTGGTYTISLAPLVIVPSAKVHLGKLPKKYTLTGYGWQGWDDDVSNDLAGKPNCKVPSKAKRKPGIYKISCTAGKLKSLNYAITFAPGYLIVKK
ncbi:MAG: hypothetical protein JHC98_06410 [Thermoleophilaceae bacterium]|nr:hypothetical protein [Thermoleophilaceae bacterium]